MRTIKFRGKRIDNGEWVYGSLQWFENGEYYIKPFDTNKRFGAGYQVIPETVGQFTGLLDKDGKEIYEGDVVEFSTRRNIYNGLGEAEQQFKSPVIWQDFRASWAVQMSPYANNDLYHYIQNGGNAILIGNIHDNPELLNPTKQ